MIHIEDKVKCTGCTACQSRCPKGCISLVSDDEGFLYPQVNLDICIDCHICEQVCPIINKKDKACSFTPRTYAAYSKSQYIVQNSSSGGLFSELAKSIISKGGYVCGAICNTNMIVQHTIISNDNDIEPMRGSKYVQSEMQGIIANIHSLLQSGNTVLFSGTPCQVAGVKHAIPSSLQSRLLTLDFVCHGVPSPKVWRKYIEYKEKQLASKVTNVSFRSKRHGWRAFGMLINFKNGLKKYYSQETDLFMQSFLRNVNLRPSCYDCQFKTVKRQSDLTLADFWGIWKIDKKMFNRNGVSLIILQSEKGKNLINSISRNLVMEEEDIEDILSINVNLRESVKCPVRRSDFFYNLDRIPYNLLYHKCVRGTIMDEIKNFVKSYLKLAMFYLNIH